MPWWVWIVAAAVLLVLEIVASTDFYLVFFGVGALVVGLIGLVAPNFPTWGEWLLFAVLSVGALVLYRGRLKRRLMKADADVTDNLVGEVAVAQEAVAVGSIGKGELRGTTWTLKNAGDGDLEPGDRCKVVGVDGLTLSVRKG